MIILGLDMSSVCIGHALIVNGRIDCWGSTDLRGDIATRCADAAEHIGGLLDRYEPTLVIIESPVACFAKAVIPQARVSGAVLAEFARRATLYQEVTPGQGKAALTGDGAATKREMVEEAAQRTGATGISGIIRRHGKWELADGRDTVLSEDEADAIGLALAGLAVNVQKVAA